MGALSGIVAHGGVPGLLAETGLVLAGLVVFGFFLWRSARKEREAEGSKEKERPNRS